MKERPIPFIAPMVLATLADEKNQTRRVAKMPKWIVAQGGDLPGAWVDHGGENNIFAPKGEQYLKVPMADGTVQRLHSPHGTVGDRLWVKETYTVERNLESRIIYRADKEARWVNVEYLGAQQPWLREMARGEFAGYLTTTWEPTSTRWRSPRFMPRWASRITLEIVEVRAQRLQDISEDDARSEGVDAISMLAVPRQATRTRCADFAQLWESINAKRGHTWMANDWVFATTFRRVTP